MGDQEIDGEDLQRNHVKCKATQAKSSTVRVRGLIKQKRGIIDRLTLSARCAMRVYTLKSSPARSWITRTHGRLSLEPGGAHDTDDMSGEVLKGVVFLLFDPLLATS
jgi:hypothetical protein